jgi:soluble lytic murein transglycosylase-like protein
MRILGFLVALMSFAATCSAGAIYTYKDRNGVSVFTNIKPHGVRARVITFYKCPACDVRSSVNWGNTRLNFDTYKSEVEKYAAEYGVEVALIRSIMHAESAFNPNALSRAGAQGLMQLMPATADRFDVSDPFDPKQNIRGGVAYLRFLLDLFDGNADLASAAYNAGEGAVLRFTGIPPYAETQVYVQRVQTLLTRYREDAAKSVPALAAEQAPVPAVGASVPSP